MPIVAALKRRSWLASTVSFVSFAVVFAWFAEPWLATSDRATPAGALLVAPSDGPLVAWVLGWVARALVATPRNLFDAPINYPAPAQLTGTEHFLGSQLIFLPVQLMTGNALLGANVVALLSYPLAATAMQRLLLELRCSAAVAWVCGALFALGPLRVPGNLQLIQYHNAFLPLVALLLSRLRDEPTCRRARHLFLALTLGLLSSYYLAVMLGVLIALWTCCELCRPGLERWKFALLAFGTTAAAVGILAAVSVPYYARREAYGGLPPAIDVTQEYFRSQDVPGVKEIGEFIRSANAPVDTTRFAMRVAAGFVMVFIVGWFGVVPLVLAGLGMLALRSRVQSIRVVARRGLLVVAIAAPLALVPIQMVSGFETTSMLSTVALAPLRIFRLPYRFVVLAGFGTCLLSAAALEAVRSRLGSFRGAWITTGAAMALFGTRATSLCGSDVVDIQSQTVGVYDMVRNVTISERGEPLLELPTTSQTGALLERDAMLGSLRHGLPLVTGATGYPSAHRFLLDDALSLLPQPQALERIVDLTHVSRLLKSDRIRAATSVL